MIIENRQIVDNFYMIRRGEIVVFNEQFHYLYNLEEGSYFGDYHIAFGLISN